jgi:hypothetical protein
MDALATGGYDITGQEFPSQRQSLLDTVFPVETREQTPPIVDVDAPLEELRTAGVQVDPHREPYEDDRLVRIIALPGSWTGMVIGANLSEPRG